MQAHGSQFLPWTYMQISIIGNSGTVPAGTLCLMAFRHAMREPAKTNLNNTQQTRIKKCIISGYIGTPCDLSFNHRSPTTDIAHRCVLYCFCRTAAQYS